MLETYARKIYIIEEEQYTANSRRVYLSVTQRFGFSHRLVKKCLCRDILQIQKNSKRRVRQKHIGAVYAVLIHVDTFESRRFVDCDVVNIGGYRREFHLFFFLL